MKKNYNLLLLTITFASLISGCAKQDLKTSKDLTNEKSLTRAEGLVSTPDKEFNLLGYGYDLTGEYSSASSATYQIIDVSKLNNEQAGRVEREQNQGEVTSLVAGMNSEDYSRGISSSINVTRGFRLFPLTIKATYKDSTALSSKFIYSSYSILIKQRIYKFSAGSELLRNYVTPNFSADVANASPAEIVGRYGTHMLSDILLGAKLDFLYQSKTRNEDRIKAASAGIKGGLEGKFTIEVKGAENSSYSSKNYSQSIHYKTVGGDPTVALVGEISLDDDTRPPTKINVGAWQATANLSNAELISINPKGLIPIYDLVSDPAKRAALKAYIDQYMIDNQIKTSTDPVTVFYNKKNNDHLYTIDKTDYNYAGNGWADLGDNFHAFTSQVQGSLPIHVFFNLRNGNHTYTINKYDYPYEQNGYEYQGIGFYAFPNQVPGSLPVHVFYSERGKDHVFTINRNDYPYEQNGFAYLGINFYAFKAPLSR